MGRYDRYESRWAPYVPVAERRKQAAKEAQKLAKKGQTLAPVQVAGRTVAATFWGKAWCEQLEKHSDYANRLPRGRTYARNGSVIDLQVRPGQVTALVSGSSIYKVAVQVDPLDAAKWAALARDCAGQIDSLVELLQGKLAKGVLARLSHPSEGLLPLQRQMHFSCSCPDGAYLCKHVAAALYGVGHRLDSQPELLFVLRQVDQVALLQHAAVPSLGGPLSANALDDGDLAGVFGLDMDGGAGGPVALPVALSPAPIAVPRLSPAQPAPQWPAPAPQPTKKAKDAKVPPPAAAFVLGVLTEFRDQECSVQDLFDWQKQPQFTKQHLAAALLHLRAKGLVASDKDDSGVIYWRAV